MNLQINLFCWKFKLNIKKRKNNFQLKMLSLHFMQINADLTKKDKNMSTALQGYTTTQRRFRPPVKPFLETKKKANEYVDVNINRDEVLESIAFLTQYMEDLKAGRPVENICEDDPWYLVPENIALMIESDKSLLKTNLKFLKVNNIRELIGE